MSAALYLASASPRRRQLLEQLGLHFEVVVADVDETPLLGEAPATYVSRLAEAKAKAVATRLDAPTALILGADTVVVREGALLGKPRDRAHGLAMLAGLSGHRHQVLSAVGLVGPRGFSVALSESWVTFRPISAAETEAYWETGEPKDKAGAYGIQGLGAMFVERLEGSYSGVMGLPLFETAALLRQAGMSVF